MTEPVTPQSMTVTPASAGRPLLEFLAEELGLSNRKAKACLDRRSVFVNGRRVWMAQHRLQTGDRVELVTGAAPQPKAEAEIPPVLFRDSHYVIVNKPAGIVVCGPSSLELDLRARLDLPGLSAVHRLDRDTTGCVMFALAREALDKMIDLFRHRRVDKRYHVLVEGVVKDKHRTIDIPIDGERSITHLELLSSNRLASHLMVRIETGRTHQIRRHLIDVGYRVLGDRSYGAGREVPPEFRGIPRQMLHAASLRFTHPFSGREILVRAALGADFTKCLQRLGLK